MKKIISTIIGLSVFASVSASAVNFNDTHGHWAEYTIDRLSNTGIVDGFEDGSFNPNGNVTRAEYLKMIMELYSIGTVSPRKDECLDADVRDWYAPYLQSALDKGLVPGDMIASYGVKLIGDENSGNSRAVYSGAFNGGLAITREEMAVITQNMYQYNVTEETVGDMLKATELSFADTTEISRWALQCVKLTVAEGFMEGMNDNLFEPKSNATRAQAATILGRIIDSM